MFLWVLDLMRHLKTLSQALGNEDKHFSLFPDIFFWQNSLTIDWENECRLIDKLLLILISVFWYSGGAVPVFFCSKLNIFLLLRHLKYWKKIFKKSELWRWRCAPAAKTGVKTASLLKSHHPVLYLVGKYCFSLHVSLTYLHKVKSLWF